METQQQVMIGWYAAARVFPEGRRPMVAALAGPFRHRAEAEVAMAAARFAFNRSCRETGSHLDAFAEFGPLRVERPELPAGSHNEAVGVAPLFGGWFR